MNKNITRSFYLFTLLTIASLISASAFAQVTTLYPIKFVCGYSTGSVPLEGQAFIIPNSLRRAVQAGSYSTAVNVLHNQIQDDNIAFYAVAEGFAAVEVKRSTNIQNFQATRVICPQIQGAFGISAETEVEGWLVMATTSDSFSVEAVYTYANQNLFIDHRYRQAQLFGGIPALGLLAQGFEDTTLLANNPTVTAPLLATTANPSSDFTVAGSGAGGNGLGSSIDLESVEPVSLNEPVDEGSILDLIEHLE